MSEEKIIDTAVGTKDGQTKCPKCGATDISINENTGELRCNFCRFTFQAEVIEDMKSGVGDLSGDEVGSGAADIDKNAESMVTLKCTSCGAEVVINLNESSQARCHWCRNMLSINSKVPNGMVPDVILPFNMKKEEAKGLIENFVGKRKFYANPKFKNEFSTENVMGVYFPYMLVDMKGHATFEGVGEHEKSHRTVRKGSGDNQREETIYTVETYHVKRDCDVEIDDLTVESSARRAGASSENETNNIINAILPFDTENCVKFDSNYLHGYTSEKRDTNRKDLQNVVDSQEQEAIKFALNKSVSEYDRGVNWQNVKVEKEGEKWLAAYLPVWLYSYVENPGAHNQLIHYVAVNARTKETIGSVPVNKARMFAVSAALGFATFLILFLHCALGSSSGEGRGFGLSFILGIAVGCIYFACIFGKYRNTAARHHFENETKILLKDVKKEDSKIKEFETESSSFRDANNTLVHIEHLHN